MSPKPFQPTHSLNQSSGTCLHTMAMGGGLHAWMGSIARCPSIPCSRNIVFETSSVVRGGPLCHYDTVTEAQRAGQAHKRLSGVDSLVVDYQLGGLPKWCAVCVLSTFPGSRQLSFVDQACCPLKRNLKSRCECAELSTTAPGIMRTS